MKSLYSSLAILGAVIPYVFLASFFAASGFGLGSFVRETRSAASTGSLGR